MMFRVGTHSRSGFALVLTLVLIALMVLAITALGTLVRVNGEISSVSSGRFRARQNALVGLAQAVGALQTLAGTDDRLTAMAGVAGELEGSQRRHWCGVWDGSGNFLGWMTSGAANSRVPRLEASATIQLVERGSVGPKPSSVTAYADEEYVDAGKVAIPALAGDAAESGGSYAYWVGDEGVKVSARAPAEELPSGGLRVVVASAPTNVARLGAAFRFDGSAAARVVSFEDAVNLSYAAGARLTAASLRDGFHHVTLTHRRVGGGRYLAGQVNFNTTSAVVWRSLIETYEAAPDVKRFGTAAKRTQAINTLAKGIAASGSGKTAGAPYGSVAAFLQSEWLATVLGGKNGIDAADFGAVMAPMLTVRSDTFRVRAYGEAAGRAGASGPGATAYCEAIVQRTPELVAGAPGRRFVITYFRWLGPNDI